MLVLQLAAASSLLALAGGARTSSPSAARPLPSVTPAAETTPVPHSDDAADDPAVWLHPTRPALSTIIGTDKRGGLAVYDLAGRELHYYADSRPNNVDVRTGVPLAGRRVALVVASDAADDSIRAYRVNPATRGLENVAARTLSTGIGAAGLCLYRSSASGKLYAFVGDNSGTVQQWELFGDRSGKVDARKVRSLRVGSTTEGCVADDAHRRLYVAEEDVGIWRYGAEPNAGSTRTRVDAVGGGRLEADVEGLAIYETGRTGGYLIASSQGSDSFAVYSRASNAYVKSFTIRRGKIDGVTHTDGIDVTSGHLGSAFPDGVFVAQDDENDSGNQNFKLVAWKGIARSGRPRLATRGRSPAAAESAPVRRPVPPRSAGRRFYLDSV
ncbi:MAG: phytase, partial [Actinobacteria bacterium]|nr:phytase [Actinomycetota bacterium]